MPPRSTAVTPQSFDSFHELLRFLRKRAELNQRELALQAGYHFSYMSRIEAGERIPDRATIQARFLPALGLEDQPEWAARLIELAERKNPGSAVSLRPARPAENISADQPQSGLPRPPTPLLGRDGEVRAIVDLLARSDTHLLTLLGPPGVGKTRLAIEAAARLGPQLAGGAVFADLSPVREPERLPVALVAVLGIADQGSRDPVRVLKSALGSREMLLVLDNFEQIVPAAVLVAELLGAAPQLKILATSRENLRIAAETEYRVPPLPVGEESPAVALFIDRARRVRPDFEAGGETLEAVAALCARLDGLPLAIELAAARVKLMDPAAMLARLDRRLEWLSGGRRDDRPDRASLRQALDWSFDLCSETEQALFVSLGVFAGGFGLEAAWAVSGRSGDVLETLTGLVDKSLVVPAAGRGMEPRFSLLETMREYARDRLESVPTVLEQTRRSHAQYYLQWIQTLPETIEPDPGWLLAVGEEYDNLRLALGWLLEHEPESGLRLADQLRIYWLEHSLFYEALPWLETALALSVGELAHPWRMRFAEMLGLTHWTFGNLALANRYLQECLDLARAVPPDGDPERMASALALLGRMEFNKPDRGLAIHILEEGLAIARRHRLIVQQMRILRYMGMHFVNSVQLDDADRVLDEAIDLSHTHSAGSQRPSLFNMKGIVAMERGDHPRAREAFGEALYLFRSYPNTRGEAVAYENMGAIDLKAGRPDRARFYFETSLRIARRSGIKLVEAENLSYLGWAALAENDLPAAHRYLAEELQLALEIDSVRFGLDALAGLGAVRLRTGEVREALQRFAFVSVTEGVRSDTIENIIPFMEEARLLLPAGMEPPQAETAQDWRRIAYVELAQQPISGE